MSCDGWVILPKLYGHVHGELQYHFCQLALVVTQSLWDSASANILRDQSGDSLRGFLYRTKYCPLETEICSTLTVVGFGFGLVGVLLKYIWYWDPGPETYLAVFFGLGRALLNCIRAGVV